MKTLYQLDIKLPQKGLLGLLNHFYTEEEFRCSTMKI